MYVETYYDGGEETDEVVSQFVEIRVANHITI
jgi:hypothetical protein